MQFPSLSHLAVTGVGADLKDAVAKAYAAVGAIRFECDEGAMYRTDIAAKASVSAKRKADEAIG